MVSVFSGIKTSLSVLVSKKPYSIQNGNEKEGIVGVKLHSIGNIKKTFCVVTTHLSSGESIEERSEQFVVLSKFLKKFSNNYKIPIILAMDANCDLPELSLGLDKVSKLKNNDFNRGKKN